MHCWNCSVLGYSWKVHYYYFNKKKTVQLHNKHISELICHTTLHSHSDNLTHETANLMLNFSKHLMSFYSLLGLLY